MGDSWLCYVIWARFMECVINVALVAFAEVYAGLYGAEYTYASHLEF
jgi:hypothetical protein